MNGRPPASPLDPNRLGLLRLPAFRAYLVSRAGTGAATTLLQTAIAWQVYEISGSALALGLLGVAYFVPAFGASLVGGAVADAYDRRTVLLLTQAVPLFASLALVALIAAGRVSLVLLYGVAVLAALALAFENPARQALLPAVVPRHLLGQAISLHAVVQSLSFILGPAVAGVLIAASGVLAAYVAQAAAVLLAMGALLLLRAPLVRAGAARRADLAAVREGIAYVRQRPVLLGAMTLDMFAVVFGGAKALLPVYAVDVLQAGPTGYGVLAAALPAGALAMSVALVVLPTPARTGRALLLSVAAFGAATIAFGASSSLPVSVLAYAGVGMADQLSVVLRQTTIQLGTPDELRGRVTAVNSVFVSASNQLGSVESGLVAAATSAVFAVVSGGIACLGVVALVAWRVPALWAYRAPKD